MEISDDPNCLIKVIGQGKACCAGVLVLVQKLAPMRLGKAPRFVLGLHYMSLGLAGKAPKTWLSTTTPSKGNSILCT